MTPDYTSESETDSDSVWSLDVNLADSEPMSDSESQKSETTRVVVLKEETNLSDAETLTSSETQAMETMTDFDNQTSNTTLLIPKVEPDLEHDRQPNTEDLARKSAPLIPKSEYDNTGTISYDQMEMALRELATKDRAARFIILKDDSAFRLRLITTPKFTDVWTKDNIKLAGLVMDLCLISIDKLTRIPNPAWLSGLREWSDGNRGLTVDDVNWPQVFIDEIVNLVHECYILHEELHQTAENPTYRTPPNLDFNSNQSSPTYQLLNTIQEQRDAEIDLDL